MRLRRALIPVSRSIRLTGLSHGIAGEVEVTGETVAAGLGVSERLNALIGGVGVAVGRGRNGSADPGQGGPVRIRGGSSGERWRSGLVRSRSMGAVLRRAPAGGRRRAVR
jgi:hypothetical protein